MTKTKSNSPQRARKNESIGEKQIAAAAQMGWTVVRCARCQRQLQTIGNGPDREKPQPLFGDPEQSHLNSFCAWCAASVPGDRFNFITVADALESEWDDNVLLFGEWQTRKAALEHLVEDGYRFDHVCQAMRDAQERAEDARERAALAARLESLANELAAAVQASPDRIELPARSWADIAEDLFWAAECVHLAPPEPARAA